MKKRIVLIGSLAVIWGCHHTDKPTALSESNDFKKAETFLSQQKIDSSFYYFDKVTSISKDSLEVAMAYNYMASIQSDAGDYFGAQESLTISLGYLKENKKEDRYCLASNYNELATTSFQLENYDDAIGYAELALKFSDDENYKLVFLNNKANAYREKGAYQQALALYQQILRQTKPAGREYARLLTNLAITKWLYNPNYKAAAELQKALQIRISLTDLRGQHSSYAHLSDYYSKSIPDSALDYATKMYVIARRLNLPNGQLTALTKLIKLSPAGAAKQYFSRYEFLNDSVQTVRNAAKNQFALIRYHSERNKADNLTLQKDVSDKKLALFQQRVGLYAMLGLFVLLTITALFWYRARKRRLELEKQDAIRDNQRATAKKVHDTLANDIYRVMKKVQHDQTIDRELLINDIDDISQRARDISYDIVANVDERFHEKIAELLTSFATETTKVILVGNEVELWQQINTEQKIELRYMLQELMVNMQKHSQAENVVIKFERRGDRCFITYFDDGIGLGDGFLQKNGLTNTGNRIKAILGEITFDTSAGKGLQIELSFPTI